MPLFTNEQAAEYLCVKPRTLESWRLQGIGPSYVKVGRLVRYLQTTLDEWILSCQRKSTSDHQFTLTK